MEWIKCSDRLPPQNNQRYLLFISGAKQPFYVGYYKDGEFWKSGDEYWAEYRLYPTHWMVLPHQPNK